jgi:hypothetical protein
MSKKQSFFEMHINLKAVHLLSIGTFPQRAYGEQGAVLRFFDELGI